MDVNSQTLGDGRLYRFDRLAKLSLLFRRRKQGPDFRTCPEFLGYLSHFFDNTSLLILHHPSVICEGTDSQTMIFRTPTSKKDFSVRADQFNNSRGNWRSKCGDFTKFLSRTRWAVRIASNG